MAETARRKVFGYVNDKGRKFDFDDLRRNKAGADASGFDRLFAPTMRPGMRKRLAGEHGQRLVDAITSAFDAEQPREGGGTVVVTDPDDGSKFSFPYSRLVTEETDRRSRFLEAMKYNGVNSTVDTNPGDRLEPDAEVRERAETSAAGFLSHVALGTLGGLEPQVAYGAIDDIVADPEVMETAFPGYGRQGLEDMYNDAFGTVAWESAAPDREVADRRRLSRELSGLSVRSGVPMSEILRLETATTPNLHDAQLRSMLNRQ